ncbi:hypothetical protein QA600_17165 [Natronococcus sp. A-GB1]|nr:hypothetical protein [Natronococcus sp. A-GB1]MDG5761065.1 hypothetical protein [Natronococcus sp. A-GB1]
MSIFTLRCYECGCEYGYIGATPHPGQCPSCDSHCVSPAGELTITDLDHWQNAAGLSKLQIYTIDERGRQFVFKIVANDSTGKLVEVMIEGVGIHPGTDQSVQYIPSVVSKTATVFGITEIETESTVAM